MRDHPVEDPPPGGVGVEAQVEERAEETAALRRAEREGVLGRHRGLRVVLYPRRGVADGGEAEPADRVPVR